MRRKHNYKPLLALASIGLYIAFVTTALAFVNESGRVGGDNLSPEIPICSLPSVWCLNEPNDNHLPVNKLTDNPIQIIAYLTKKEKVSNELIQSIGRCESLNAVIRNIGVFNYQELKPMFDKAVKIRGNIDNDDVGYFQTNLRFHPYVSVKEAEDIWFTTQWVINEIKAGNLWKWDASKGCWG